MKVYILSILLFLSFYSCKKIDATCMQGNVVGKIRSSGGGLAVTLNKKYKNTVHWKGHKNIVEVLNIPLDMSEEGTTIYFTSRIATTVEQGPISADGDEGIKLVLYGKEFNKNVCP